MVHMIHGCDRFEPYGRHLQDYWKLSCPKHTSGIDAKALMRESGFQFTPSAVGKGRVIYLLHRCQRKLLSYDSCSISELRTFLAHRGLSNTTITISSKTSLIHRLEQADNDLVFERFSELPPELRCSIYDFHIKSFDTIETQPLPLTQVSRLVRQESRPLFYEASRFMVRITNGEEDDAGRSTYEIGPGGSALFHALDADSLSRIRHLRLKLDNPLRTSRGDIPYKESAWDLNLPQGDVDATVTEAETSKGTAPFWDFEDHGDDRAEKLQDLLSRLEAKGLQRGTLQDIIMACSEKE